MAIPSRQTVMQLKENTKITKRKMLIFQNLMSLKVWLTSLCMLFTNCYLEIIILKRLFESFLLALNSA